MAETELSNEVVATTTLPEITNLSVTEVSNGFELSWSVNDNNTTGNIAIERSTDNGNTFNRVISGIPRTTETFTDSTNFDADNPIYRIVRATDDAESVSSEIEYTEPTIPEEVPVAETLESTVTDDGIELTWRSDETDGEFIVYRDTNSGTTGTDYTQIDTVPAFTFNKYLDSGVSSGERYYYRTEYSLIDAVGGNEFDVTIDGVDYRIHEFTSDGTFSVNQISSDKTVDVLVVGGGGGGGGDEVDTGGGGAGGLIYETLNISSSNYNIIVGSGGSRSSVRSSPGENGENSSAFNLVALGGGGGASYDTNPSNGGSGGGATEDTVQSGGTALQPNSASGGFGNNGGSNSSSGNNAAGGGGGAGESGYSAQESSNGGDGLYFGDKFTEQFGENGYFAGGGGGGGNKSGSGGLGGGGDGRADQNPTNGQPNTGGGGGGAANNASVSTGLGSDGGSGIVLIRYKL